MSCSAIKEIKLQNDDAIVVAAGDINAECSVDFQRQILEVVDKKPKRIIVDLTEVGYMESSGLASLVKILGRTKKESIELHIGGLGQMIRGLFEVTRLDSVFNLHDSMDDIVAGS